MISEKQKQIILSAWGARSRSPGFRTHYCTGLDDENMLGLVSMGFFHDRPVTANIRPGYGVFYLTKNGIDLAEALFYKKDRTKNETLHR